MYINLSHYDVKDIFNFVNILINFTNYKRSKNNVQINEKLNKLYSHITEKFLKVLKIMNSSYFIFFLRVIFKNGCNKECHIYIHLILQ